MRSSGYKIDFERIHSRERILVPPWNKIFLIVLGKRVNYVLRRVE